MFELLVVQDELIVQPQELNAFNQAIETQFKGRYLHKVVAGNGLCVALKTVLIKDKIVVQGEGTVQVKVITLSLIHRPRSN